MILLCTILTSYKSRTYENERKFCSYGAECVQYSTKEFFIYNFSRFVIFANFVKIVK